MRETLNFPCAGHALAATLDHGDRATGLLIVSGGNEIRIGAHRGMARLAADMAKLGYPVIRFDRRGVGDSAGENGGFASSGPDIVAAAAAFRRAQPQLNRVVAFGNCDAATALVIHRGDAAIDGLVLANPWIIEPLDGLPPGAAIRDHYARRARDPSAWTALLTGRIGIGKLARGLGRIAVPPRESELALAFARALHADPLPTRIVLATHDGTALSFAQAWRSTAFDAARGLPGIAVSRIDSVSHSFAGPGDFAQLVAIIATALGE